MRYYITGMELKLAADLVKSARCICKYLELHQTITYHQLLKRQFLSIPPNTMTTDTFMSHVTCHISRVTCHVLQHKLYLAS